MDRNPPPHVRTLFTVNLPPEYTTDIWYGTSSKLWRLNIRKTRMLAGYVYQDGHHAIFSDALVRRAITPDEIPALLRQIEALAWLGEL